MDPSSHQKHSFISIDIPWTGNSYGDNMNFANYWLFYFSILNNIIVLWAKCGGFIAGQVSWEKNWRNSEYMGCSVSPREKWQVQMGVCVLSAWIFSVPVPKIVHFILRTLSSN